MSRDKADTNYNRTNRMPAKVFRAKHETPKSSLMFEGGGTTQVVTEGEEVGEDETNLH